MSDRPNHQDEDISQLIAWDFSNLVYCNRLYDISGRLLVQLRGGTPDFTPDGRYFISASLADDRTVVYDLRGNSITELEGGDFQGFTANGQQLVIREAVPGGGQTYLYDLSGRRLVTFGERQIELSRETDVNFDQIDFSRGISGRLSPNRLQVATSSTRNTSYLYDLAGNQIAQFEGIFLAFTSSGQQVVTYDYTADKSYLYNIWGRKLAEFQGEFLGFSPSKQQLVTYDYTASKSYLYDIWGRKLAEFRGRFLQFSSDGQFLMTSTRNDDQNATQNHVYDLLGSELEPLQVPEENWRDNSPTEPPSSNLPAFQGEFRSLSPDGQLFLTNSEMIAEQRIVEERIRVGELSVEDFARSVCSRVTR